MTSNARNEPGAIFETDPKVGSAPAAANVSNRRALQNPGAQSWSTLVLDTLQIM